MPELDSPVNNGHAHPNPELATESDYSPPRGNPFPVVGIGASAGGLEAFAELLAALPERHRYRVRAGAASGSAA